MQRPLQKIQVHFWRWQALSLATPAKRVIPKSIEAVL